MCQEQCLAHKLCMRTGHWQTLYYFLISNYTGGFGGVRRAHQASQRVSRLAPLHSYRSWWDHEKLLSTEMFPTEPHALRLREFSNPAGLTLLRGRVSGHRWGGGVRVMVMLPCTPALMLQGMSGVLSQDWECDYKREAKQLFKFIL